MDQQVTRPPVESPLSTSDEEESGNVDNSQVVRQNSRTMSSSADETPVPSDSAPSSPDMRSLNDDDKRQLRSPSALSESTKPDPPSIIANSLMLDEQSERERSEVPRGGDAAETASRDGGGVTIERETKEGEDSAMETEKIMLPGQPLFINVPSTEEEEHSVLPDSIVEPLAQSTMTDNSFESEPGTEVVQPTQTEHAADKEPEIDDEPQVPGDESSPPLELAQKTDREGASELDDNVEGNDGDNSQPADSTTTPSIYDAPLSETRSIPEVNLSGPREPGLEEPQQVERRIGDVFGPDEVVLLPRVDEHLVRQQQQQRQQHSDTYASPHSFLPPGLAQPQAHVVQQQSSFGYGPVPVMSATSSAMAVGSNNGGRRKIRLRLQEDVRTKSRRGSVGLLGHIRSRSSRMMFGDDINQAISELESKSVDRGNITVSWFDGTSSLELQAHVRKSVERKLRLEKHVELADIRILDESVNPPEEIVLSPYIPNGSQFLLRFTTKDTSYDGASSPISIYSGRAPESPSAAPSPHPGGKGLGQLDAKQLALLQKQLNEISKPKSTTASRPPKAHSLLEDKGHGRLYRRRPKEEKDVEDTADKSMSLVPIANGGTENDDESYSARSLPVDDLEEDDDDMMLHSEDPIEARLRQITELLISDRQGRRSRRSYRRTEKRQVIFVLANYFVLFLSLIAISAEIQARAPNWLLSLEGSMKDVQDCAENQEALFKCVSNGDFAGLVASVILWLSRSVATRRIFLFGFETPKRLWTVVYESLVTSVCWGFSYLFIRRGMNPDTRRRFVQKYWKDAVYGSLAGFNAAFMKQILKNLIPQEVVEDALRDRQLKILSWLPSFA